MMQVTFVAEISNQEVMTFSEIKQIVGITNVKIKSSSFRFSELYARVDSAATMKSGVISIVLENGSLNSAEFPLSWRMALSTLPK